MALQLKTAPTDEPLSLREVVAADAVRGRSFMKLKMLKACLGSPDGRQVLEYLAGETYDLPEELGQVFVLQGWARPPRSGSRRTKNAGAAPANKSVKKSSRKPPKPGSGGDGHGH